MTAGRLLPVLAAVAAGLAVSVAPGAGPASAAAALPHAAAAVVLPHPGLVPESPARGYPVISRPAGGPVPVVMAADQAGRHIVAGGSFQQVTLQDGTVEPQPFLAVWNIDTKQLECPNVTVDNTVTAVEPGPTPDTVYIGGTFTRITGPDGVVRSRVRLALLHLPDCSVDTTFAPPGPSARVEDLVLTGNRLFVGGNFTRMGTTARAYLAEVDATTGRLNPAFSFPLTKTTAAAVGLRGMGVNPAATRLVLGGNFTGSFTRVIDITDPAAPRMTAHASFGYRITGPGFVGAVTDASVSPDGTRIALTFAPGGVASDMVAMTPTTETLVTPAWQHFMRDSPFSVAVSNNAVYVGGHFCHPDGGPGPTQLMSPWPGINPTCTGSTSFTGGVWRSHMAALSPADGTPLTWNAGNASVHGATSLTVTTRGLLIGFDGARTHSILTGPLSFLDFGPAVEPPAAAA